MQLTSLRSRRRATAGFTLVELLVTLFIVSVGMLGLVKLEAAGVSESHVSRMRSLMTYQAESLAGLMRADRGYWASTGSTFTTFNYSGSAPTFPTTANSSSADCTSSSVVCKPSEMAYADLKAWTDAFGTAFPGATLSIACSAASGGCASATTTPASYDITLTWTEKTVASNRSSVGSTSTVSMVLHVQP